MSGHFFGTKKDQDGLLALRSELDEYKLQYKAKDEHLIRTVEQLNTTLADLERMKAENKAWITLFKTWILLSAKY